jgi:release factor glutamine methyltransferase
VRLTPEGADSPRRVPPSPPDALAARLRAAGCVFAEDEARLLTAAATTPAELEDLARRRVAGEPLEHLLGAVEFCGLRVAVGPGVFVPRQRTAALVARAADAARAVRRGSGRAPVAVDLCCGCGAVGLALAIAVDLAELHAADVDPATLPYARRNLARVGGRVHGGDLFEALPGDLRGRVDVLVVNAPYVPTGALPLLPPEARLHEPRVALDGGRDGLDVHRRVTAGAPAWLAPGGVVLGEVGEEQAPVLAAVLAAAGLQAHVHEPEEDGTRVVTGTRSAS